MNYTLIGYTEDSSYRDRCGDWVSQPGDFTTLFFREAEKAVFLKAWAAAKFHSSYDNLIILLDGIPEDRLEGDEYYDFQDLEREMETFYAEVKVEHDKAEAARKEALAEAAVKKARELAAIQRERDLQQLAELKRKLGV